MSRCEQQPKALSWIQIEEFEAEDRSEIEEFANRHFLGTSHDTFSEQVGSPLGLHAQVESASPGQGTAPLVKHAASGSAAGTPGERRLDSTKRRRTSQILKTKSSQIGTLKNT